MRVTVRLFARLREIAGAGELVARRARRPRPSVTVWAELARRHPGLAPYASSISAAREHGYARMDTAVSDGDEIAFLPPVSGGACETAERSTVELRRRSARRRMAHGNVVYRSYCM